MKRTNCYIMPGSLAVRSHLFIPLLFVAASEEQVKQRAISGFRCVVNENCVLLGYYVARSGNFLTSFRDNLSDSSSRYKNPENQIKMSRKTKGRHCCFVYILHQPWYFPFIEVTVANHYHWNYTFR
jgi:hypothetical protein